MEILVGRKPLGNYITAVMLGLKKDGKVTLKARGNNIRKAIDVVEILKKKDHVKVEKVETNSTLFKGRLVSGITIEVKS